MNGHPTDDKLLLWLETGKPGRIGRHVEDCDVCLARVEDLSGLDGGLLSGLVTASAPPKDLAERTTGGVQGRLAAEEAFAAFLDLFAVPWSTATVLFDSGPRQAPGVEPSPVTDHESDNEEHADG